MKKLLIYIFCFFALLACNKEESVRLQKEETIITGTVTEQQRGIVIEGATVYLLEYLYPGNDDKCGTCQKIIDSTLTDANGNFEFRFNAKQGTNWNYKTWCEKQNYITKIASRFNDIVKEQSNTANLALYATGGLSIYLNNKNKDTVLYVQPYIKKTNTYADAFIISTLETSQFQYILKVENIPSINNYELIYIVKKRTYIGGKPYSFEVMGEYSKTYFIESNLNKADTLFY